MRDFALLNLMLRTGLRDIEVVVPIAAIFERCRALMCSISRARVDLVKTTMSC